MDYLKIKRKKERPRLIKNDGILLMKKSLKDMYKIIYSNIGIYIYNRNIV